MFSSSSSSLSTVESALHQEYNYVCEREKEAAVRNKCLMEDLAKLKMKIATFSSSESRSHCLSQLKWQYENYVETNFSDWMTPPDPPHSPIDPASQNLAWTTVPRMDTNQTHPPDPVAGVQQQPGPLIVPARQPGPFIIPVRQPSPAKQDSTGGIFHPLSVQIPYSPLKELPPLETHEDSSLSLQSISPREVSPPNDISLPEVCLPPPPIAPPTSAPPTSAPPTTKPGEVRLVSPQVRPPTSATKLNEISPQVGPPTSAPPTTKPGEVRLVSPQVRPPTSAPPTTKPSEVPRLVLGSPTSAPPSEVLPISPVSLQDENSSSLNTKPATSEPNLRISETVDSKPATIGIGMSPATPQSISNWNVSVQVTSGTPLTPVTPFSAMAQTNSGLLLDWSNPLGEPGGQGAWEVGMPELSTASVSSDTPASQDILDEPLPLDRPLPSQAEGSALPSVPSPDCDDSAMEGGNSISALTRTSMEESPLLQDRKQMTSPSESSSQISLPHDPSLLNHPGTAPQTSAYRYLLRSSFGGGEDDASLCLSETSGDLTDANVEKELLQVLEGGVAVEEDEARPVEVPSGEQQELEGRGIGNEDEVSSRSTSPEHIIPSSLGQSAGRRGLAPATMTASLKRRLGLISSDEESDGDLDMQLHLSMAIQVSTNEEAEFDFLT